MTEGSVQNVIRPCFSLTEKFENLITGREWVEYDIFSKYYLERFRRSPRLYECIFDARRLPDYLEEHRFEVYRIWGHICGADKKPALFLVQYICDNRKFTKGQKFEFRLKGEISFQPLKNVRGYKHLDDYLRCGSNYFGKVKNRFDSIKAFHGRNTNPSSLKRLTIEGFDRTCPSLSDFLDYEYNLKDLSNK